MAAPMRARLIRSWRRSCLRVRRRSVDRHCSPRRFARLLDGPIVAFVTIAASLLERLAALPYDLERAQVFDGGSRATPRNDDETERRLT